METRKSVKGQGIFLEMLALAQSLTVCLGGWEMKWNIGWVVVYSWKAFKVEKGRAMGMADGLREDDFRVPPLLSPISLSETLVKMTVQLCKLFFFLKSFYFSFFKLSMCGSYLYNKKEKLSTNKADSIGKALKWMGDFPGSPVVKTQSCYFRGHRFDPWSGK